MLAAKQLRFDQAVHGYRDGHGQIVGSTDVIPFVVDRDLHYRVPAESGTQVRARADLGSTRDASARMRVDSLAHSGLPVGRIARGCTTARSFV